MVQDLSSKLGVIGPKNNIEVSIKGKIRAGIKPPALIPKWYSKLLQPCKRKYFTLLFWCRSYSHLPQYQKVLMWSRRIEEKWITYKTHLWSVASQSLDGFWKENGDTKRFSQNWLIICGGNHTCHNLISIYKGYQHTLKREENRTSGPQNKVEISL